MFALINTQNASDLSSTPLKYGLKLSSREIGEREKSAFLRLHFDRNAHVNEEWIGAMHCVSYGILNRIVDIHNLFHFIGVVVSEMRSDNIMTVGLHTQFGLRFGLWLFNISFYLNVVVCFCSSLRAGAIFHWHLFGFTWHCV